MPTTPSPTRRSFLAYAVLTASAVAVAASIADASEPGVARVSRPGGFAGSSGEAGPQGAEQVRLDVGPTLPGIDVSHWQGTIDWQRVAEKGKRFAFLKATDGHDILDPTFFANRAGARANGLLVGAYHFARPDPSKGDAVEEARWFVSQADPRPGYLLPVLDLETSRGLDQQDVTLWARRWTAEVRRLTGVTPLVYTSPHGWERRTGDTRALARDGSPLWIAHWGVESPLLPAGEWDGNGWHVWQYTSHGQVAGIAGRVDLDVVRGNSLGPITIRRLSLEVEGDAGTIVSAPAGLGCSSTCEKSVDPDTTVTLTARPDDGAYFTGWGGACSGTDETCTITMRGNRSVHATFVTDITAPVADVEVADGFRGPVVVAFDEPVRHVDAANVLLQRAGDDRVTVTRRCRSADGATVGCDGLLRSVMLTPSSPLVPGRDYEVLVDPPGADPVVDRVGNAAAALVHPFEAARSVEQGHAPVALSPARAWRRTSTSAASGGAFALSERAGSTVRIRFDGAGIDWVTVTGPNRGRARLWVDGEALRIVDLFAATRAFGVVERVDGLTDGAHTLTIEVLGRRAPSSSGTWVAVDRFDVLGP
ncbi:MAG TPA: GH25 family lysozyme [Actinomycetota bacterium]|nr:GH25 family lysozyme [Actinomycetota bacterium]